MSVIVQERPLGRDFEDGVGGRIGYVAFCDNGEDEDDVVAAVEAVAPASYAGTARGPIRVRELAFDSADVPNVWDVEVPYGVVRSRLNVPVTGQTIWSGTTSGGTAHVGSPLEPGTPYTDPTVTSLPIDWGSAIGATKDGIGGVDVPAPLFTVRAVKYVAQADINTLRSAAFELTGCVNDASFALDGQTFDEGEVLFLGMTWAKRTEVDPYDYECSFEFSCSLNAEDLVVGDISVDFKEGWQYLDITYSEKEDAGFLYKKPIIATVHTVSRKGDLSDLGL